MRAGREAEAGEFLNWRPAWSTGIQSGFQDIQGYAENLLFQETKEREREEKNMIIGFGSKPQESVFNPPSFLSFSILYI